MRKYINILFRSVVTLIVIVAAEGNTNGDNTMSAGSQKDKLTINDISQEKWDKLAQKKILFGHQSVGNNIINGINQILKEHSNIKLKIIKYTRNADDFEEPVFAHDWIGKNMSPESKTRAFAESIYGSVDARVDIAFMKTCYFDLTSNTNV